MQAPPLRVLTYQQVFVEWCGFDPLIADVAQVRHALAKWELDNVLPSTETDVDVYLHLLMSHVVEPGLALIAEPIAVINFPASQASLACINEGVAERFEVYYRGVELANGFHELTDASLQAARFEHDVITRDALGLPAQAPDEYLLAALQHGLPPCSGVALGIDRLMAICLKQTDIASTLAFDFSRA
jgi:lysyl-tRNA synthetase class 2